MFHYDKWVWLLSTLVCDAKGVVQDACVSNAIFGDNLNACQVTVWPHD